MSPFRPRLSAFFLALVLGTSAVPANAVWSDKSAGLPLFEYIPSKDIGPGDYKSNPLEDKLGRLFVGGDGLQVFDGQSWRTFPVPHAYPLRIAFGENGRIWAAGNNEAGYFDEISLGEFKYHSLIATLRDSERLVGQAYGCASLGRVVYFIFRDQILRWDGTSLQLQPFPGESRLYPIEFEGEHWFHHLETGLYRLTESGPHLEFPAAELPPAGILGLARDDRGLLVASGHGFYRPGRPPQSASGEQLNLYVTDHRVAGFLRLPDGSYSIGTLTGGLLLASKTGEVLRLVDEEGGLPSSILSTMRLDASGHAWSGTASGLVNFEGSGHATIFNQSNGLKGAVNRLIRLPDGRLLALTLKGAFELETDGPDGAEFRQLSATGNSHYVIPTPEGLILLRHGGIDFLVDGQPPQPLASFQGTAAYEGIPVRGEPGSFYILEYLGLFRLRKRPDGSVEHTLLAKKPDFAVSLHEDTTGRVWIGTVAHGAFVYQPGTSQFLPVLHPSTGQPMSGLTLTLAMGEDILLLGKDTILRAAADGSGLKVLAGGPPITPISARPLPGGQKGVLVAFARENAMTSSKEGLGILTFEKNDSCKWQELDTPALSSVGSFSTMAFTQENDRPVLWVGGSEGVLRLDYGAISAVTAPAAPNIQLDLENSGRVPDSSSFTFSFKGHRLNFHVFTENYVRSKDWRLQTRLGNAEWSAPVSRRNFEFTNLSEGEYRFEARTVNAAGLASEPAGFVFRILPPWYRSGWAYAGYGVILLLGVVGAVRVRERRIKARNQELETLVGIRTAELVKANAAKDEFLAGISHEIRNPMNGVIGIAENFRTEALDLESRRKFSLLRQCASHLSSLLEDILDFSKVQAGAIELDPKPFDLPELVESVAGITRADSEKYGIPVEVAVSPAVPRKLVGDGRRIRQILINFVSNALKFSGRGEVNVTVWCKEAGPGRTEVIFAVSDEGPGISPEEQARLFTRFERGAAAQKGRVPGTGLGLALCKGLAEKMGGKIWLESEIGRGSCFYFSAPFPVIEPAAETSAPPAPAATTAGRAALVVDDQEYNRIVLTDLLQAMGFSVHSAQEGQAALNAAAGQAFDVIFLDFNLPGLSGVDVARGIRALPGPSAHALLLATTAFNTPEKRAQCLDAGMDAFLGKPVTRERLTKALAGLSPVSPSAGRAAAPAPSEPIARKPAPADPLGNLRLLARKKGVSLADELAAYFIDLDGELAQLNSAINAENADDAGRFSHMLCGRCSFIYERDLEQLQRKVEAAIADLHWAEARNHNQAFARLLAERRLKLVSSDPAAPPA